VTRERPVSSLRSSNPCMRTSRPEATPPRLIPFVPSLSVDHAFETCDTSTWATLCAQLEPLLEGRSVERAGRKLAGHGAARITRAYRGPDWASAACLTTAVGPSSGRRGVRLRVGASGGGGGDAAAAG
jgi:hypothetical protein